MQTIYRVHDINCFNSGMYCSGTSRAMFKLQGAHPSPVDDGLFPSPDLIEDYLFGFADMVQLRNWIYKTKWLRRLHKEGYCVSEVISDHVISTSRQAAFHKYSPFEIMRQMPLVSYIGD